MTIEPALAENDIAQRSAVEPDWQSLRREFPATDRYAYLDIGRKALLPRTVQTAMNEWIADVYENAGASAFSMDGPEDTRAVVADVFGAPPETIALVRNTSEGINIVAQGFPWIAGDNVVISKLEHEGNTFPWRHLEQRGIEVRWAEPDAHGRVTPDCYGKVMDARTRIIGVAWVAYGNGYRADLPGLAAFCKEHGIKLVVDAIQAVGVLSDPISSLGADVLIAGGHKAQFSLTGAGLMYATPEMIELLKPAYAGKFSFTSNDRMQSHPELAHDAHRFEYGNPNFLGLWVQKRSAEFVRNIGLGNIEARVRDLTTYLMEEAEGRQIKTLTPRPWEERAGIVAFKINGDADAMEARLKERMICVAAKDGNIRAAVHFYNDKSDIDRFLEAFLSV